jgi:hypothetical protein
MHVNYQQQKTTALTYLGHLQGTAAQLQELLKNAKSIRHEQPLPEASRNASVT